MYANMKYKIVNVLSVFNIKTVPDTVHVKRAICVSIANVA